MKGFSNSAIKICLYYQIKQEYSKIKTVIKYNSQLVSNGNLFTDDSKIQSDQHGALEQSSECLQEAS